MKSRNNSPFQNHTFRTNTSLSIRRDTNQVDLQSLRISQVYRSAVCVGTTELCFNVCGLNAERNIPRGWDAGIEADDDDGG